MTLTNEEIEELAESHKLAFKSTGHAMLASWAVVHGPKLLVVAHQIAAKDAEIARLTALFNTSETADMGCDLPNEADLQREVRSTTFDRTILDRIETLLAQASPGEWHAGCLVNDEQKCNCAYIFDEGHLSGVGSVFINNGLSIGIEGGNDAPPLAEAKANLALIVELRNAAKALVAEVRTKLEYEKVLRNVIDHGYHAKKDQGWRLDEIMDQSRAVLEGKEWRHLEKTSAQIEAYKKKWND